MPQSCNNPGCTNDTTDAYCSYHCKEASDHRAARNRSRIINNTQ